MAMQASIGWLRRRSVHCVRDDERRRSPGARHWRFMVVTTAIPARKCREVGDVWFNS